MKQSHVLVTLACYLAMGVGTARAGAPQPDQRREDFVHICKGGPSKGQPCSLATQDTDCPKSQCVLQTVSKTIPGRLTIIAHDSVTDWLNGGADNRALTVMLEVKAPDRSRQILTATYQNLATPTDPPQAPPNVVSIAMDEAALSNLAGAVDGLMFVQPESTLAEQLQTLFTSTGTPVLAAVLANNVQFADHTGDDLASTLRFKVKVQFVEPV